MQITGGLQADTAERNVEAHGSDGLVAGGVDSDIAGKPQARRHPALNVRGGLHLTYPDDFVKYKLSEPDFNVVAVSAATLSIIIPVFNDRDSLEKLLADLGRQRGAITEVLVVDGGSSDGAEEVVGLFSRRVAWTLRWLVAPAAGRGVQMNTGAQAAGGDDLLFLHADSRLMHPTMLADAAQYFSRWRRCRRSEAVAGHFNLEFSEVGPQAGLGYYYFAAKTALNRPECINGDQGLWIAREFFFRCGGFDESLPYMEDARFARRLQATVHWVLLPGTLLTSARRFVREGFASRQLLNALLRLFDQLQRPDFFQRAEGAYRCQAAARRLHVGPFLKIAHEVMGDGGGRAWLRAWWDAAQLVSDNVWQVFYFFDCYRHYRRGGRSAAVIGGALFWFERRLRCYCRQRVFVAMTMVLCVAFFYGCWGVATIAGRLRQPF